MYESPIHLYESPYSEIVKKMIEDEYAQKMNIIMEEIKRVGVHVDKDELLRALSYNRDQYYKGYNDVKFERETPSEYWYYDEDGYIRCTCCKKKCPYQDYDNGLILTDYCGFSGKKMHKKGYDKFEILEFEDERVPRY
jgi:hypothetical protein